MAPQKFAIRAAATQSLIALSLTLMLYLCPAAKGQTPTPPPTPSPSPSPSPKPNEEDLVSFVTVMDRANVADVFGSRISKRYIALQVTVENLSDKFQYLIHDISLDLDQVFPPDDETQDSAIQSVKEQPSRNGLRAPLLRPADARNRYQGRYKYRLSSLEHSLLRGVAEKGQGQDKRNLALRVLRGFGTIAAGFMGVTPLGKSYAPTLAMFNGPALTAYTDTFPDYTINQLNRLNDSAYRSNTLVPKQSAKILVVFIPQSLLLTKKQRDIFSDSMVELSYPKNGGIDFRRAEAIVKGSFVTEVGDLPPSLTTVVIDPAEAKKFQDNAPQVKGYISGKFLSGAKLNLDNQSGLTIENDGAPTNDKLPFIIKGVKPVPTGAPLNFEVINDQGTQKYFKAVSYTQDRPQITKVETLRTTPDLVVTITGKHFMPDIKKENVEIDGGVRVTDVKWLTADSIEATVVLPTGTTTLNERKVRASSNIGTSEWFTIPAPSGNNE